MSLRHIICIFLLFSIWEQVAGQSLVGNRPVEEFERANYFRAVISWFKLNLSNPEPFVGDEIISMAREKLKFTNQTDLMMISQVESGRRLAASTKLSFASEAMRLFNNPDGPANNQQPVEHFDGLAVSDRVLTRDLARTLVALVDCSKGCRTTKGSGVLELKPSRKLQEADPDGLSLVAIGPVQVSFDRSSAIERDQEGNCNLCSMLLMENKLDKTSPERESPRRPTGLSSPNSP